MTTLIKSDLVFMLDQIRIAEEHAAGKALSDLVASPQLPDGLRLVNGSYNNLLPGQEFFGAADQVFPRLRPLDPANLREADAATFDPDGPGPLKVGSPTSYTQTSGLVFDALPRLASNLVVDQSPNNPAAVAAAGSGAQVIPGSDSFFIPNVAPDVGLSAPFNSWFTLFGQFFDHGLDLTKKGGSGTVIIPLAPDDPLRTVGPDGVAETGDEVTDANAFMMLTRATNLPGADGVLGTKDDVRDHINHTTPWVDQNQTYTSHPSHQVFLREYAFNASGDPVSTGHLIDGATGGIGNWAEIKEQARTKLGINLTDADVTNVPLILTDAYGKFIPGANGLPQLVLPDGTRVEGNLDAPVSTVGAARTGHAFLDDIANSAAPSGRSGPLTQDTDTDTGNAQGSGTYDNELLDRHFVTGDGRGNENIGLTAVHTIFHAEHNRLVEHIKAVALESGDRAHLNEWLLTPLAPLVEPPTSTADPALNWNGERLFQAARLGNEMQYQHLVFEEFARKVQPEVNPFSGYSTDINPAIMAEFAHVVYRFGHSMLTETVDRIDKDGNATPIGLIEAFLNPVEFDKSGTNAMDAAANIVRGMTQQVGNEIDEFVTGALRNNLVGLPLDLAAINIARARDTGMPGLNEARQMFYEDTNFNSALKPYDDWVDFGLSLKHPESLINFVAAYGTHDSIKLASTLVEKRAAAKALVEGTDTNSVEFMNSSAATSGLNDVDFWLGGLAEKQMVFGGLLGSTFNFVFETQMERLQDGDRFYYLSRLAGLNFLGELEGNSFAAIIERNLPGVKHLPGDVFSTPAFTVEMAAMLDANGYIRAYDPKVNPEYADFVRMSDGTIRYTGVEHIVMGGTDGNDKMRGSEGDDTLHGDAGNDRLEGGDGNDFLIGGDGDDIITDLNGVDNIKGGNGNDVINAGPGLGDLILAGAGHDFTLSGGEATETFGSRGNDFLSGGASTDTIFGGEDDDWIEGGDQADLLQGDMGDPFQASRVPGNDVIIGGGGNDDYDAESGDDIMVSDGGTERHEGMLGFDWVTYKGEKFGASADLTVSALLPVTDAVDALRDRFDGVEGLSGWRHADILRGSNNTTVELSAINAASGFNNAINNQKQIDLISGLQSQLDGQRSLGVAAATSFSGGDILLGGDGSDLIEGRGGDDIIDGDAWLNVRISIRDKSDATLEIGTADSMGGAGTTLSSAMFAGTLNPGQLRIVREITTAGADGVADTDVAVFTDVQSAYDITAKFDAVTGVAIMTVAHVRPTAGVLNDGTDTLRNIELMRFTDGDVRVPQPGEGAITISDTTPTEGDPLTADVSGLPNVNIDPQLSFQWRVVTALGTFVNIAGETSATFTPTQDQVLSRLQVVVSYKDVLGISRSATSTPTGPVGDRITGTPVADTLEGSPYDDNIMGLGEADFLYGMAGSDVLSGGGGADLLDGGSGVDRMAGGAGSDTYVVDETADQVVELVGQGADTVRTALDHELAVHVENLVLVGTAAVSGTGNALANVLTGNSAANTLNGAGGVDTFIGGGGDDVYLVDNSLETVTEIAGEGTDTVQSTATFTLGANIENLVLTGDAEINGTGNGLANQITGNGAANVLNGRAGADTMAGGAGNDTYVVDNAGDTAIETEGGGVDEVQSSISWTLGAWVERLTLTGAAAINGTGNGLNNVLMGNSGANILNGLIGADEMAGGGGNDTYVVDDTGDTVIETIDGGTDLVQSSLAAFTLSSHVENLTLLGGAIEGNGNELANTITGNRLNNVLDGGVGADRMVGGAGNDTYMVDNIVDVVTEGAAAGTDLVMSSAGSFTLAVNVENLTLTGAAINGTGNAGANTIIGNAENNLLSGAGGNDTMTGGDGNDILTGAQGADRLTGGSGADTFRFDALNESGLGAVARDIITDFQYSSESSDRIDLRGIDARSGIGANGDQAFTTWVGDAANFTGQQQLGYTIEIIGSQVYTVIRGNVNANIAADFSIALEGDYTAVLQNLTSATLTNVFVV